MAENVAVEGLTFSTSGASTVGEITINSTPSSKTSASGKGVYRGPLSITLTGFGISGCESGVGNGSIPPTSTKELVDGLAPIREGDQVVITVTGTTGTSSCEFPVTIKVDSAGQNKYKAN